MFAIRRAFGESRKFCQGSQALKLTEKPNRFSGLILVRNS
jgi:hypothetical protein